MTGIRGPQKTGRRTSSVTTVVSTQEAGQLFYERQAVNQRSRDLARVIETVEASADFNETVEITLARKTTELGEGIAHIAITKVTYTPKADPA